jgi:hypothetical protein
MTEKSPWVLRNKVAVAGTIMALGLFTVAQENAPQHSDESQQQLPDTTYAITKDCARNPKAYQKITLSPGQHVYLNIGLRAGKLKNRDVVTVSGTSQELTVTPYDQESRTVFPDKLTQNLVEEFPFSSLGTVAIAHMNGETAPSVILACDIDALTQPSQPLDGQVVTQMPPMQPLN